MGYEYTVIPAPSRGEKAKGSKTGIERFSVALAGVLNEMAQDGWEYVRAETLPCEERAGLTGRTTVYHNILVFRRALDQPEEYGTELIDAAPAPAPAPVRADPQPHDLPADEETAEPAETGVRAPFSQPMRATPRPAQAQSQSPGRMTEPPLSAPEPQPHNGPRLGPANR